jgi:hypothetical protein
VGLVWPLEEPCGDAGPIVDEHDADPDVGAGEQSIRGPGVDIGAERLDQVARERLAPEAERAGVPDDGIETGRVNSAFALIRGDPGIGKSAVLRLLDERLGRLPGRNTGSSLAFAALIE